LRLQRLSLLCVCSAVRRLTRFSVFFAAPARSFLSPLSLHDALPISKLTHHIIKLTKSRASYWLFICFNTFTNSTIWKFNIKVTRSEEHTSELQSRFDLVCRLLLEKKNSQTPTCRTHRS